uniref:PhoPQ-activated pathogenicity-related protein n=1 Tax=Candidatus Kentrum eta TaxID=2126337 RepID=A0A450UGH5_9GAMM|nr:MAG: PhoPQ-activated pathogenicity-related protein [Candidatus Kentron sp. H]VFJ92697.1 MAG: PhoPQ-activated pathogenicity-related protein [Candidatus Kentron sp. H]VFJ99503.1 MAG: PhoPQ-activated pathogenicity-related protein [Candidatus Kentron sp. H]
MMPIIRNVLLACLTLRAADLAVAAPPPGPLAEGPLAEYVAKPDASYHWVKRQTGRLGATLYAELTLTSQTWRGIAWKHRLFVLQPSTVRPDVRHGLLFIAGGRWDDEVQNDGIEPHEGEPPDEVRRLAGVAERLRTPVVVLRNVPRQPLFGGLYEDRLISLTFDKYLETRDPEWPLLLPMVKSAARAMDAAGQYAHEAWGLPVETYTVTGKSKRGWTTWLLGAVDPRVTAIAPMVIDVLNMARQMDHQRQTWGDFSHKIHDYTERGLQDHLDTPSGKALLSMVDPYSYRDRLKQPKLIILGTNDHYWPLDALNLYWDGLVGDKYLLYVPNNGHDLTDSARLIGTLDALHQHAATGRPMPKLAWKFARDDDRLSLHIDTHPSAREVRAWVATAPTRDFRAARWRTFPMAREGGRAVYELATPPAGFTAVFGEVAYHPDPLPCYLSTNVRILGRAPDHP